MAIKSVIPQKPIYHILIIVLLGFLVYSNTFHAPFIFDDDLYIIENPAIKDFKFFTDTANLEKLVMYKDIGNFFKTRFMGHLTFALNYRLNVFNVFGYHLFNLCVHIINALLVYWIIILTFRAPFFQKSASEPADEKRNQLIALFSSLLFVSHPIQTQAVTYISQRFTSLATLFFLLSLVMYIKWRTIKQQTMSNEQRANSYAPGAMLYAVSILSAVLAMKTKEISFTLPVIIALYEFIFFEGKIKTRLIFLIPILLTILIIPLTLMGVKGSLAGTDNMANTLNFSRWDYLFTQFRVIVTYIRLMFFPVNQNVDYDYPLYNSFFSAGVFLSFLFLLSVIIFGAYMFFRSSGERGLKLARLISFGIFWFFITLSVESSIIPITDLIFEHRLYLPSVGFFIAVIASVMILKDKLNLGIADIGGIVVSAILILSGAAYARNAMWKDKIMLWSDNVNKSPRKARVYHNLGSAFLKQGRTSEAFEVYKTALQLAPKDEGIHLNMGLVYEEMGQSDEALQEYQNAVKLNPSFFKAHNNIGTIYAKQGRLNEALQEYQTALRINPYYAEVHNNLGNVFFDLKRFDDALREYQVALKLNPTYAQAHNNLGNVFFEFERFDEALREYQIAKALLPGYVGIYNSIGTVYFKQGRFDEARQEFETALKLDPNYTEVSKKLEILKKKW
ncbi:MAG: tetratricopeptide repeat protein [Thermodesulfovibrionales bacterium]